MGFYMLYIQLWDIKWEQGNIGCLFMEDDRRKEDYGLLYNRELSFQPCFMDI